ncbi:MAG TPA: hypothetical protein VIU46_09260 [Gallionellaceae bacterium]
MADLKSARQLLDEMPKNDALKALVEVNAWLESVRSDELMRLDTFFSVISLLDETARPLEIKVLREYLASGVNTPVVEKRQWNALHEYYSNLGEAYHGVLLGCHNGEKGASELKDSRPLIVARGINATVGRLKCAAVHYAPVEPAVWEQLGEYYTEAETQKCLDVAIELYPGASVKHTIRHQLAGALLWWGTGTGSLKPLQVHLAERLTMHVCGGLTMGPEPGEDALYSFDLTKPRGPVRHGGGTEAHPNLRFIGHGGVQLQIEPLIEKLGKDTVPGEVNLGGSYPANVVCDVAKRLAAGWRTEAPSRRHARRSLNVNLNIVTGYAGLIDVANLAAGQRGAAVTWVAEDVSATGFRCTLEAAQGTGLQVGSLIGYRPENVQYWGAGIVRRLRHDDEGMLDVGVEILANRATRVKLGEDSGPAASGDSFGVLLAGSESGDARVLLRPGSVDESHTLVMQMNGKSFQLAPQGLQDKGNDFDLMKYHLTERAA